MSRASDNSIHPKALTDAGLLSGRRARNRKASPFFFMPLLYIVVLGSDRILSEYLHLQQQERESVTVTHQLSHVWFDGVPETPTERDLTDGWNFMQWPETMRADEFMFRGVVAPTDRDKICIHRGLSGYCGKLPPTREH